MQKDNTCKSCQNQFSGNYCNLCGEKIIEEKDFSLQSIIGQAIGAITNLDSKLFRSLKLLFFYPGKLSLAYVQGIRVPYMKPFQIFVLSNIFFFIFLSDLDVFRSPSKWFFVELFDGIRVLDAVREVMVSKGLSQQEVAIMYDAKSSELAKGLVIVLIPVIALIGRLLNWKREYTFGKHIIFAIHYFSFILCILVFWFGLMNFLEPYIERSKLLNIVPVLILTLLYYVVGLKKYYQNTWISAVLKGTLGLFLINFCIHLYRVGINLLTLNIL